MKSALALVCMLWCCSAMRAQAPAPSVPQTPAPNAQPGAGYNLSAQNPTAPTGPVVISEEPHHRLVLQNDFVHVYNVMVPALDFTLLHQHDLPYLYVVLGPADILNAIVGKPDLHQVLQDGETHFSPGHFAHVVRTDSGVAFHNITVELVHPQGTPKNVCVEVLPGAALSCPEKKPAAEINSKGKKGSKEKKDQVAVEPAADDVPYFETDEVRVDLHRVSSGNDYVDAKPKLDALLVGLTNANLDVNLAGEHVQFLHEGDVQWLPVGQGRRIVDFLGTHSSFLLIEFKDSAPAPSAR